MVANCGVEPQQSHRISLEARAGFEPAMSVLQTNALDQTWLSRLARMVGVEPTCPGFGVQSTHPALTRWLQEMDSNHRDDFQRVAAYR